MKTDVLNALKMTFRSTYTHVLLNVFLYVHLTLNAHDLEWVRMGGATGKTLLTTSCARICSRRDRYAWKERNQKPMMGRHSKVSKVLFTLPVLASMLAT